MAAFCKQAGDGVVTDRRRSSRNNIDRKKAMPSTAVSMTVEQPTPSPDLREAGRT